MTAFTVALIGGDGAGKTTIARQLPERLGRPAIYLYMGVAAESSNRLLPTTRLVEAIKGRRGRSPLVRSGAKSGSGGSAGAPARAAPDRRGRRGPAAGARGAARGALGFLRLANRLAEEWYRQGLTWYHLGRGQVVIFDRHFFCDYHAVDIVAQNRTLRRRVHGWILDHVYPRPNLVIYLDAPPEILLARKGEGTLDSLARRREDYLLMADLVPAFVQIDANRPLDDVATDVVAAVLAYAAGGGRGRTTDGPGS